MGLTEATAAQRAFLIAKQRLSNIDGNFIPRAIAALPDARTRLAKRIAAGSDFHNAQKEFALTAVAGRVDLSMANAAANTILFDPHRSRVFIGTTDIPAVYVERLETIKHAGLPTDTYYFTHRGQSLIFLNSADNQTNTLAGTVNVVANFVWAITEIPAEFEKELLDILVEIASPMPVDRNAMSALEGVEVGRA